jgi:ABC-type nitrate/sulfonate/bicarbonate transport system substrate-binding protein
VRPIKMLLTLLLAAGLAACAGMPGVGDARAPAHKEVTELKLVVYPGGFNWPLWVGNAQGFFLRNGVGLKLENTPNPAYQMVGLVNGTFDIALPPLDDVIAYREGQGTRGVDGSDLLVVMGGDNGFLKLVSVPQVHTIPELRGKTLAVDSIVTGTSFVLREILDKNGLEWKRDYTTEPAGVVQERFQDLLAHRHAATMLISPLDVVGQAQGLNVLADAAGALGSYQGMVVAVRRKWARQNPQALVAFIRGYRQSLDWLYNPANREAALEVFRRNIEADSATAESAYRFLIDPVNGFEPHARLNEAGARTVLRLREKYALPAKKLQPLAAYYDPQYYNAAAP